MMQTHTHFLPLCITFADELAAKFGMNTISTRTLQVPDHYH